MFKMFCILISNLVISSVVFAQVSGGGGNLPTLPNGRSSGNYLTSDPRTSGDAHSNINDATRASANFNSYEKMFTVNGPFDGTVVSVTANKTTIYQVNIDFKNPNFQMLNSSSTSLETLSQAYKLYNLNLEPLKKLSVLFGQMNSNPTASQLRQLEELNFKIGFSGSKSFLIDGNSKYIVPLN